MSRVDLRHPDGVRQNIGFAVFDLGVNFKDAVGLSSPFEQAFRPGKLRPKISAFGALRIASWEKQLQVGFATMVER